MSEVKWDEGCFAGEGVVGENGVGGFGIALMKMF